MNELELLNTILNIPNKERKFSLEKIPISEQFKDKDGYYKRKLLDGTLAVQNVDENGNPIKYNYIGGTTEETRNKFWKQSPIIRHAVDSIANEYNIKPATLRKRLDEEGFVDALIKDNNYYIQNKEEIPLETRRDYSTLNGFGYGNGFQSFGLDNTADYILEGKVKPINEEWYSEYNENEKGKIVHSANGKDTKSTIGLTAAQLKYFQDVAKKDFPNANRKFLEEATHEYYKRGEVNGKNYMKNR